MAGQALALLDCRKFWALSGFQPQPHAHLPTWPSSWTFVQTQRHRDSKWGASCPPLLRPPHCSPDSVVPSSPQGDHPGAHWESRRLPNTHIPVSPIMRNPYPPCPPFAGHSQTCPLPDPDTQGAPTPSPDLLEAPTCTCSDSSAPCRLWGLMRGQHTSSSCHLPHCP